MTTITGRYVNRFAEANMGMLDGVSLNAPYEFFWVYLKAIDSRHIVCTGAGKEMRLPFTRGKLVDKAKVTINDPIFGPIEFTVSPFLRDGEPPIGNRA